MRSTPTYFWGGARVQTCLSLLIRSTRQAHHTSSNALIGVRSANVGGLWFTVMKTYSTKPLPRPRSIELFFRLQFRPHRFEH